MEIAASEWLIATYRPTTPFSLRISTSTSSGGKTLLLPTPYGVKLGLVDAAIRMSTVEHGRAVFDLVKACDIRFRPPEHAVVNNTFVKVWREREIKNVPKDPEEAIAAREDLRRRPYQDTIAYREFCCFTGDLEVAFEVAGLASDERDVLVDVLPHVSYFGKRGSFFQFIASRLESELSDGYSIPLDIWRANGGGGLGTIQVLDDLGEVNAPDLFDRVNTYSDKRVELLKHRRLVHTVVPYEQQSSSRGYTYYRRAL